MEHLKWSFSYNSEITLKYYHVGKIISIILLQNLKYGIILLFWVCKKILWLETVDLTGRWNHPWLNLFIFLISRRTGLTWYPLSFHVSNSCCGVRVNTTERYRWLSTRWLSDSVRVRAAPQSLSCCSVLMHRSDSLASTLSYATRKWITRNYKNTLECWIRPYPLLHCSLYTRRIRHNLLTMQKEFHAEGLKLNILEATRVLRDCTRVAGDIKWLFST